MKINTNFPNRFLLVFILAFIFLSGSYNNLNASKRKETDTPSTSEQESKKFAPDNEEKKPAPRNTGKYLELTEGKERVLVIGSGHAYGVNYPENYCLANHNDEHRPDCTIDITKRGDFPDGFIGEFDVVIWERVDTPHFVKDETMENITTLLKSGGKLIANMMINVMQKKEPDPREKEDPTKLKLTFITENNIEYFYYPIEKAPIPFIFYVKDFNDNSRPEYVTSCFKKVFVPWLSQKGFANIERVNQSPYWKASPDDDGYIIAIKK